MAWYRAGGGGIPSSLKTGMNSVLNKKFGTSTTYDPAGWPDDVNLLGKLPEKTVSGAIANFSDGADEVPLKDLIFSASPIQAAGTPSPSNPLPISGHMEMNGVHTGKNLLNPILYDGGAYNPTVDSQRTFTESATQFTHVGNTYSVTFTESWKTYTMLIPVKYGQAYYCNFTLSGTGTNLGTSVYFVDADGKVVASASNNTSNPQTRTFSVNVPSGAKYFCITFTNRGTAETTLTFTEPQIEVGSSATSFAPYSAETKKWSFPPFGKNQWDEEWEVGSISTSTGENTVDNNVLRSKDYIPVTPNATMTWSCGSNASAIYSFFGYDSNKTFVGTITNTKPFTIPSNVYFIRFRLYAVYGTTYLNDIQIEVGSTATSYEPYQSMFSGYVNALTGKCESSKKLVIFTGASNENWTVEQISGLYRFRIVLSDVKISSAGRNEVMSNIGHFTTANEYNAIFAYQSQQAKVLYYYPPQGIETVEDFKTWLTSNNLQVCYDLADPIEIDMDSVDWQTQLGDNNFFNDCGDTSVTYRADIDLALGGN